MKISYPSYRSSKERRDQRDKYALRVPKKWVDPFPTVHGTLPEKMVYAELSFRGIQFYFLNDFRYTIPEIDFSQEYQTDFVIPDLKLIIEVQGAYWHSKPGTIEADAFKFAVYQITGWRTLAWWDFDILANLPLLFAADPQLAAASRYNGSYQPAELTPVSRKKQDTSQGIRTLNYKRGLRSLYKKDPVMIKKKYKSKGLFS
ncbi:hypothetical protein UFOVP667_12 [uncultured Caudovirales phage]|uniref:Uncharacterized protein n=1 Tax=uncultured Caudovirales phage TaxID=2100421 RepID=A0A6J5N8Y5_9CAUD|nr:hypothetical protein UFOVP667_12 [uncultured Caudovirales phage]